MIQNYSSNVHDTEKGGNLYNKVWLQLTLKEEVLE